MLLKHHSNRLKRGTLFICAFICASVAALFSSCADKPAYADTINTAAIAKVNREAWQYNVAHIYVEKRKFSYFNDTLFLGDVAALQKWECDALAVLDSNYVSEMYMIGNEQTFVFCNRVPGTKVNGGFVLFSGPDALADLKRPGGFGTKNNLVFGESNDTLCWFGTAEWRNGFQGYLIGSH